MTAVMLVTDPTRRADDLTERDYRDIYQELRQGRSLADFLTLTQSAVSRAWWSQYEAGGKTLDWQRKNELRRAVGLPELAPSVASAMAHVAADASIWQVGEGLPDTVILVTPDHPGGLLLSVNADVHMARPVAVENANKDAVTPVTSDRRARRPVVAIGGLRPETRAAHEARRRALGLTWDAYLGQLLEHDT